HQRQLVVPSSPFYKKSPPAKLPNPTNGSWWFLQVLSTKNRHQPNCRIPPTAVGGSFKSFLQKIATSQHAESHQRQLVVPSSPFYKELGKMIIAPTATLSAGRGRRRKIFGTSL